MADPSDPSDPSDPKPPAARAIPSWQRAHARPTAAPGAEEAAKPQPASSTLETVSTQAGAEESAQKQHHSSALLDAASKFLQDPSIRDAPRERKAEFLESKGVSKDDIRKLLGSEGKGAASSRTTTQPASTRANQTTSTKPPQHPSQPHDIPPIVTYPEFLVQPQKPPPLLTISRILNTVYAAGGTAAALYALSRYVVAPMKDDLNSARHDLLSHTQAQLATLTAKLSSMVSSLPAPAPPPRPHSHDASDAASDAATDASDPTELFHRDAGTQTSPGPSRRPSSPSLLPPAPPQDALAGHEARLAILSSHLAELVAAGARSSGAAAELLAQTGELTQYLAELCYASPYYGGGGAGGYAGRAAGRDDGVDAFKAEIRGVKGVLLSARNFPGGRAAAR